MSYRELESYNHNYTTLSGGAVASPLSHKDYRKYRYYDYSPTKLRDPSLIRRHVVIYPK